MKGRTGKTPKTNKQGAVPKKAMPMKKGGMAKGKGC